VLHLFLALIVELVLVVQMQIVTFVSAVVLDSKIDVVIFFALYYMSTVVDMLTRVEVVDL
jgi:hypothetical protein|tara:strand:- start:133 stop:312 length:180 start_codon:yes stop_codon:yes gene_type:complete